MSQKPHNSINSMVVLSELGLFMKISICDALSLRNLFNDTMYANWMCYALTQELEQLKLSSSTKSTTLDKFITENHKETVSNNEFNVTR